MTLADIGAAIRVIVRFTDANRTPMELISPASEPVMTTPTLRDGEQLEGQSGMKADCSSGPEHQLDWLEENVDPTPHAPTEHTSSNPNQSLFSTLHIADVDSQTRMMRSAPSITGHQSGPSPLAMLRACLMQPTTLSVNALHELLDRFETWPELETALDLTTDALDNTFRTSEVHAELWEQLSAGVSMTLTAGDVHWALRSGSLDFSIASSMPIWQPFAMLQTHPST